MTQSNSAPSVLPVGWQWATLEELVPTPKSDIVDGPFGSNMKASEYQLEGVPIIRLQNIDRNQFLEKNIRFISSQKAERLRRHEFIGGDVVVTKLGDPLGKACVVPRRLGKGIIVADVVRVRVDERLISKSYIVYAINSDSAIRYFERVTKGTTRPRVNLGHIRELSIPVSPLAEQHRIVAEIEKHLTRLDSAVAGLKRIQANLKRYRASVLKAACEGRLVPTEAELARREGRSYETAAQLLARILKERRAKWEADQLAKMQAADIAFKGDNWKAKYQEPAATDSSQLPVLPDGWTWVITGQIAQIQGGIQKQPNRTPKNNAFPFLRVANVFRGKLELSEIHHIELFRGELRRLRLEVGDLLIVEGNGSASEIGRMAIWNGAIKDCVHQNHIIRARLLGDVLPGFVTAYWNSPEGARRVLAEASSTSGLYTLSVTKVGHLPVPLPPLSDQRRIVTEVERRLSTFDEIETLVAANLKRSEGLRQSVLKRAFEGKLVPQDPNDEPASALLERIHAERAASGTPTGRVPSSPRGASQKGVRRPS